MATNPLLELPHMAGDLDRFEHELRAAVRSDDPELDEMALHLFNAGGKRIRPLFAMAAGACADDHSGPVAAEVVRGGVAVELVHLGSLHHDDVIDEAETRHTVPSVNARWGNLRAILSGDFLLAKASELAASLGTEVAGLLAATIGQLTEGEVRELSHAFDRDRPEDAYFASIDGKTAALFSTACRIGALVGGLPAEQVDALTRFGTCYGTAFQIVDDILDVVASDEQLGKPSGHDLIEGIYTLPVLRTLAEPRGEELRRLLGGPLAGPEWDRARAIVRGGNGLTSAEATAREWVGRAGESLAPLRARPPAVALTDAAAHLLSSLDSARAA